MVVLYVDEPLAGVVTNFANSFHRGTVEELQGVQFLLWQLSPGPLLPSSNKLSWGSADLNTVVCSLPQIAQALGGPPPLTMEPGLLAALAPGDRAAGQYRELKVSGVWWEGTVPMRVHITVGEGGEIVYMQCSRDLGCIVGWGACLLSQASYSSSMASAGVVTEVCDLQGLRSWTAPR